MEGVLRGNSLAMPNLSIIIVNWNTKDLLADCLDSIMENGHGLSLQIFVVDTDSPDGCAEMVRTRFPDVHLIENETNVGFAAANNQALPLCFAEYVMLLNSDTQIVGNALVVLVDFLNEHPRAGAIGPKIVHPLSRLRTLSCGYQPTLRTIFNHYFFLSRLFPESQTFRGYHLLIDIHDDRPRPVEWLSGACLLVRRQVIEQVGPLREDWFMYVEDLEWCDRISAGGWELIHVPDAVVQHYQGASTQRNKAVSTMWIQNLKEYFVMRSRATRLESSLFSLVLAMGLTFRAVLYWVRGLVQGQSDVAWRAEGNRFLAHALTALKSPQRQR